MLIRKNIVGICQRHIHVPILINTDDIWPLLDRRGLPLTRIGARIEALRRWWRNWLVHCGEVLEDKRQMHPLQKR